MKDGQQPHGGQGAPGSGDCVRRRGERELGKIADAVFTIPDVHPLLSPILFTIPLQLLAYHIAVLQGKMWISRGTWPK